MTVPNVVSPPALQIPGTILGTGLVWTPTQWYNGWNQKKDVLDFFRLTLGATATLLTTDGNPPGLTNVGSIPSGTAVYYTAQIIILNRTSKRANLYSFAASGMSNIAGTVAAGAGNPAVVVGPTLGGGLALAANPTIIADNVNKGWLISYTPPVANADPIFAQCTLELGIVL